MKRQDWEGSGLGEKAVSGLGEKAVRGEEDGTKQILEGKESKRILL